MNSEEQKKGAEECMESQRRSKMNKEELLKMLILLSKIEGAMSYRDLPVDLSNELSGFIADVAHTIKEM